MLLKKVLLTLAGILLAAAPVFAQSVSVEVVADDGSIFPTYPVDSRDGSSRAYLQAEHEARYGIRIKNNTDQRVGVVVAVDGRNIISGEQSHLRNTEKMYVLQPYAEGIYRGWRSDRDSIQRFYFTTESDSYAGSWGDGSAMGVIAVAVYAERAQEIRRMEQPSIGVPLNRAAESAKAMDDSVGTGWGEREHSPSRRVAFEPESDALERHFYKSEGRETLCRKHVISCRPEQRRRDNRMWDDDDSYAPAPPGRY